MAKKNGVGCVQGTTDALPPAAARLRAVSDKLFATYAQFGYEQIDTPVLEARELYLKKSSPELTANTYTFTDPGGQELALRPEMTASVLRAYLDRGPSAPEVRRWCYSGPVFRYQPPAKGRYRQFTDHGLELIGASGPLADAEVIQVGLQALECVGVRRLRLILGHVGALRSFLDVMGLSERVEWFLLGNIHRLARSRRSQVQVKRELEEAGLLRRVGGGDEISKTLRELPADEAESFVRRLLKGMDANFAGNREPDEIVQRLLKKVRAGDEDVQLDRAIEFVVELGSVRGEPDDAIAKARSLISGYRLDSSAVEELGEVAELLKVAAGPDLEIEVDFSLVREMAYYTGVIFEVFPQDDSSLQLCGGGRYDGLADLLGAKRPVAAIGLGFRLERVASVAQLPPAEGPVGSLVCAEGAPLRMLVAEAVRLRKQGEPVRIDLQQRTVDANMAYARSAGIGCLIVVRQDAAGDPVCESIRTETG